MKTSVIELDKSRARELYREYKKHQHYSEPIDWQIQRAYQLIAQGRVVIKALESIRAAGVNEQGLPKLAISNATYRQCTLEISMDGHATMAKDRNPNWRDMTNVFRFPADTFPRRRDWIRAEAIVPLVPIHLRPKRALGNYHILWEVEWTRIIPKDPLLLRRIGGDLWLVVAAWDLTEVERAALATRVSG